jgi:hypothetical protein
MSRQERHAGCGGEPNLRGYNMQPGTQYAHTAAGDNFVIKVSDCASTDASA